MSTSTAAFGASTEGRVGGRENGSKACGHAGAMATKNTQEDKAPYRNQDVTRKRERGVDDSCKGKRRGSAAI